MCRYTSTAAMLLVLASCTEHGQGPCLLIGCDSGAQFVLDAIPESDFARLTGAQIEVCLNATCRVQVIEVLPPPNDVRSLQLGTQPDPQIEVSLSRTAESGAIEIEVVFRSDQPENFHDGDVYTVTIVDSDGGQLVGRAWSVDYRTFQPNGPVCEPTCRSAISTTEL